jgi:hypothetical protein
MRDRGGESGFGVNPREDRAWAAAVHFRFTFACQPASSTGGNAMVVLVVLLWACSIVPGSCAIPGEPWLPTLRERLEQAQRAVELEQTQRAVEFDHALTAVGRMKPLTARDAERQEFLRRWLELRMAKEKADADAK